MNKCTIGKSALGWSHHHPYISGKCGVEPSLLPLALLRLVDALLVVIVYRQLVTSTADIYYLSIHMHRKGSVPAGINKSVTAQPQQT